MIRRLCFVALAVLGSCTLDTELPRPPPIGLLTGRLVLSDGASAAQRDVSLFTPSGVRLTVETQADGRFGFGELAPGVYTLLVRIPTYEQLVLPGVAIRSAETTDVGDVTLTSLRGTPREGTVNGVVSAMGGGSVFGATVDFLVAPANDKVTSVVVGASGLFSQRVPPGQYVLRASHPNYVTTEMTSVMVMEAALTDLSSQPIVLPLNPATLSGTVLRERDGLGPIPAAGVLVTLDTGATTTTDMAGAFSLGGLPAGLRAVRMSLAGYVDTNPQRSIELRAGQGATLPPVTLALARGTITGLVELTDRAPIDVATVTITGSGGDGGMGGPGYGAVVSPDPLSPWQGSYTISNVPYGTYEVAAARQRYSRATTIVTVSETPAIASTLQLTPQLGEFEIDDLDPESTTGFTRRTRVRLNFTRFPTTGVTDYRVSSDPTFADAGFVPYTGPQVDFDIAPPDAGTDGVKVIYAQYRQVGGATSPAFQNSVTLDRVPPSTPTVVLADTGSIGQGASLRKFTRNNQVLPLSVTGTDDRSGLSGMRVAGANTLDMNGLLQAPRVSFQPSTVFTRSVTADGEQRVYVQLVDNAGNRSALGEDFVIVDTVAPAGSLTIARGTRATVNGFTNIPQVEVTPTTSMEPNGGVVQVKLGNSTGPELDGAVYGVVRNNIPWTLSFGADGMRTVFAVLRDSAGNTSMPFSATITLDTTPPSPVSATLQGPALTNSTMQTVLVSSTAMDLSPTQAITVSEEQGFTASGTVGPLPLPANGQVAFSISRGNGLRTFYVRFRDGAGNDTVTPVVLTLDQEAPTGGIRIEGALADGSRSTDLTTSPNVTILTNVIGATKYRFGDQSLSVCPPDVPATPYTALPTSGSVPHTLTGSGATRTVRACFRDAAENLLGGGAPFQPEDTIDYDDTAPTGCTLQVVGRMADGSSGAPPGRTARTEVTATITGCSDSRFRYAIEVGTLSCASASYDDYTGTVRLSLPAGDGLKTVSACVQDVARNSVALMPVMITLDTTPPSNTSVLIENGDLFVNLADYLNQGSQRRARLEATFTDATRLDITSIRVMPPIAQTYPLTTSPANLLLTLPSDGTFTLRYTFSDDLGNATTTESASVIVDTVAPVAPVLTVVELGNRSARLFWSAVPDVTCGKLPSCDAKYELLSALTPGVPNNPGAIVPPTGAVAPEGVVTGLLNRREYNFGVRAYDAAGNPSALSNVMTGTVGWRRASVPLSTTYPVRPLDVGVRGNELFVVYSERDAEWLAETGNLRMAYSADLGRTWQFSTIDPAFGWDRRRAKLTVTPSYVNVASVGADQDPAAPIGATLGELRIFTSTDGLTWVNNGGGALANTANYVDTSGVGSVLTGNSARFFGVRDSGGTNVFQAWSTAFSGFVFPTLTSYYDHTDGVTVRDLRTCSANFDVVHAWREGATSAANTQVMGLWHRFISDNTFTVGVEGTVGGVATASVGSLDLACAALGGSTNAYVVWRSTGNPASLGFRSRRGALGSWAGSMGTTLPTDVDPQSEPRIYASGARVFVLYRNTVGAVVLGESNSEGDSLSFRRIEGDARQGRWPVLGGTGLSDTVIAWTDLDSSSLTVLVPSVPGTPGRALPGVVQAGISWNGAGQTQFRIDRDETSPTLGPPSGPWASSFFTVQPTLNVGLAPSGPASFFQISGVDAFNQGSDDGEVWRVSPFVQQDLVTPVTPGAGGSTSTGLAAHDDSVLVLPPFNFKASGSSDLTVYTSSDRGVTMTPRSPAPAVTTTAARAVAGGGGRAIIAYRLSGAAGLRARLFTTLTPTTYPSEVLVDNTTNVDALAIGTLYPSPDNLPDYALVTANVATDQVTFTWYESSTGNFTTQTRITIPNAVSDTLREVGVWRVAGDRVVIAWRQASATTERIYYVEATKVGAAPPTFSYGAPVLAVDGSVAAAGNQLVAQSTVLQGWWNGSFAALAHVSQDRVVNPTTVNNLSLTLTGTEHPNSASASSLVKLTLDQQPALYDSFDLAANDDGLYLVYQTNELGSPPNSTQLKMAVCYTDCHLLTSWSRSSLGNYTTAGNGQLAPAIAVSTTSDEVNFPPTLYVTFKESGVLRLLRGGVLRRIR